MWNSSVSPDSVQLTSVLVLKGNALLINSSSAHAQALTTDLGKVSQPCGGHWCVSKGNYFYQNL